MTTYLTLDSQLRAETDPSVIDTLLRKGWQLAPDKPSADAYWENGAWVVPPPPPPPPDYKIWSNAQAFMAEFSMPEKAQIALSTDPTLAALRLELSTWLSDVYANDPRVVTGLDKLVELGIITEARKQEVIAMD